MLDVCATILHAVSLRDGCGMDHTINVKTVGDDEMLSVEAFLRSDAVAPARR